MTLASSYKMGGQLIAAGAKITWASEVPKPTQADYNNGNSQVNGRVRVEYANGQTKEVDVSAYIEPQVRINANKFYYVDHVGDTVDSSTQADSNGNVIYNPDNDVTNSVISAQNLLTPGAADVKLLAPLDTSSIGIHWAEVQVTDNSTFTNAAGNTLPEGAWPAGTHFKWLDDNGSPTTISLKYAGETHTGQIEITLPSGSTDIVKDITVVTNANIKLKNETIDYGAKLNPEDLVTNKDVFPAVSTPHIKGYTPNMKQVAAQKVTPDSSNIEFTVVYHKDKKAKPDQKPHGKPQTPAKGGNFKPGKVLPTDTITGPHGEVYFKNGYYTRLGKHYLPQTGAHENMLAIFWGGLASSIGLFGLAGKRKKKDEE